MRSIEMFAIGETVASSVPTMSSYGTILVSNDFRKVYLVLGIAQSIGEVYVDQTIGQRQLFDHPFPDLCLHNPPFSGLCVVTTLLPWQGKIVYDGIVCGIPLPLGRKLVYRTLCRVYKEAVDKGKVISSLP